MDPMQMASAGISSIGKLLGGIGAFAASRAQAKALQQAANMARREAGVRASIALEEGDRAAGRAATLAAASGGGITGSASAVLDDLARQSMYGARLAAYEGASEGQVRAYEAKVARREGDIKLMTAVIESKASLLGGMGKPGG